MAYLILVGGPKVNTLHTIGPDGCKVGRGMVGAKHLSLDRDTHVSRRGHAEPKGEVSAGEVGHAEFSRTDGAWYVRDLKSENGVFVVEGDKVFRLMEGGSKKLRPAMLVECGQTPILFMDVETPPSAAFIAAASQSSAPLRPSGALSHPEVKAPKSTQVLETPVSEVPELIARWATIRQALQAHGYGRLLA